MENDINTATSNQMEVIAEINKKDNEDKTEIDNQVTETSGGKPVHNDPALSKPSKPDTRLPETLQDNPAEMDVVDQTAPSKEDHPSRSDSDDDLSNVSETEDDHYNVDLGPNDFRGADNKPAILETQDEVTAEFQALMQEAANVTEVQDTTKLYQRSTFKMTYKALSQRYVVRTDGRAETTLDFEEDAQAPSPHDGQDRSTPPTRENPPSDQTYQGDHVGEFSSAEQEPDKGPSSGDFLNGPSKGPSFHSSPASTNQQGDAFNKTSQQASMGSCFTNCSKREQSRLNGNQSRRETTASGGTSKSFNMYPSTKASNRNKQTSNNQPNQEAKKKNVHH